jgi:hypothetical protein
MFHSSPPPTTGRNQAVLYLRRAPTESPSVSRQARELVARLLTLAEQNPDERAYVADRVTQLGNELIFLCAAGSALPQPAPTSTEIVPRMLFAA